MREDAERRSVWDELSQSSDCVGVEEKENTDDRYSNTMARSVGKLKAAAAYSTPPYMMLSDVPESVPSSSHDNSNGLNMYLTITIVPGSTIANNQPLLDVHPLHT